MAWKSCLRPKLFGLPVPNAIESFLFETICHIEVLIGYTLSNTEKRI